MAKKLDKPEKEEQKQPEEKGVTITTRDPNTGELKESEDVAT